VKPRSLLQSLHPNDREKIEQSIVTNERHRIFPKATRTKLVRHVDKERESDGKIVLSAPSGQKGEIQVEPNVSNLVCVRSINAASPPPRLRQKKVSG
jgi:hypothetical protein